MKPAKTLKAAKKRCWAAVSKYIRLKHSKKGIARCVTCKDYTCRWQDLDAGHFIHGLTYAQADDGFYLIEENIWPQCAACNRFRNVGDVYTLHMIDTYGREFVEWLQQQRHKPLKMKIDDYFAIESELKGKIEELENEET